LTGSRRRPTLLVLLLAGFVAGTPALLAAQRQLDRYDHIFRKYGKRYFGPAYDWREFKAQGLTESGLDSAVSSVAGAQGLMQLMPSTFEQIQSKNPEFKSIDDPDANIAAGISYVRQLWRQWADEVSPDDQRHFMFGSYNAGRSTLLRAQNVARLRGLDDRTWAGVVAVAPDVPRWRHEETLTYLDRIVAQLQRLDLQGRVSAKNPLTSPATSPPPPTK
jgi:membrane-bound lytic murein transglycosylase F